MCSSQTSRVPERRCFRSKTVCCKRAGVQHMLRVGVGAQAAGGGGVSACVASRIAQIAACEETVVEKVTLSTEEALSPPTNIAMLEELPLYSVRIGETQPHAVFEMFQPSLYGSLRWGTVSFQDDASCVCCLMWPSSAPLPTLTPLSTSCTRFLQEAPVKIFRFPVSSESLLRARLRTAAKLPCVLQAS